MTTTCANDSLETVTPQPGGRSSPWIERACWLSLTLLLCLTNFMALLDHDFRSAAYRALARIAATPSLGSSGLSTIANTIESASPAALEKKAVARATAGLVAERAALQREVEGLKRDRAAFLIERQGLQKQLRASQAVISQHRERIARFGVKVLGRAGRSVLRHLATLPGHALPVLSATVAVGSVALDIQDACDSVKELDELNQSAGLPAADRSTACGKAVPSADELLAGARDNWKKAYETSAEAINAGAQMIPRSPPVSLDSARAWLFTTFQR